MGVDLCIFCEREVTWVDEAISCDICAKWQHRLGYTGITEDIYNAANRNQAEFVCDPCQHDLQPRHDTEESTNIKSVLLEVQREEPHIRKRKCSYRNKEDILTELWDK